MENKKENLPVVAAFDFDGTLTYRDSLPAFIIYVKGFLPAITKLAGSMPAFVGFFSGRYSRQEVKEHILKKCFEGIPLEELQARGREFAANKVPHLMRQEGYERIRWHLNQGHRCVLISANLDVYLKEWGRLEGFRDVICSCVEADKNGRVTGKLAGPNCWGPEKARRLAAELGPKDNYILYVYGDSRGDGELLDMADYPFYRKLK